MIRHARISARSYGKGRPIWVPLRAGDIIRYNDSGSSAIVTTTIETDELSGNGNTWLAIVFTEHSDSTPFQPTWIMDADNYLHYPHHCGFWTFTNDLNQAYAWNFIDSPNQDWWDIWGVFND